VRFALTPPISHGKVIPLNPRRRQVQSPYALHAFLPTPMHLAPPYALFAKGVLSTPPRAARGPDTTSPQSHRNLPGRGSTPALAQSLFLYTLWLGVGRSRARWIRPGIEAHTTSSSTPSTRQCWPTRAVRYRKAGGEAIRRTRTLLHPWLQRRHRRKPRLHH
jgi:hypothetical protein